MHFLLAYKTKMICRWSVSVSHETYIPGLFPSSLILMAKTSFSCEHFILMAIKVQQHHLIMPRLNDFYYILTGFVGLSSSA